jgi:hypothetical protein
MKLRSGDWVEVRSKEEILRTLDKKGQLDGMPFMTQMFQYCGQRFRVYKRAHKTCDTVNVTGSRRIVNAVHLELRCDGEGYGGCQAGCLIFWKTAWLKIVGEHGTTDDACPGKNDSHSSFSVSCTELDVWAATRVNEPNSMDGSIYVCQATQLPYFTTTLRWWDIRQYVEDYTAGNITIGQLVRGFIFAGYQSLVLD